MHTPPEERSHAQDCKAARGDHRSRRPPKSAERSDGGGAAAAGPAAGAGALPATDGAVAVAAADSNCAFFSIDARESPGMSGRLEGMSQGCRRVEALLLLVFDVPDAFDEIGLCTKNQNQQTPPHCILYGASPANGTKAIISYSMCFM